MKTLFANNEKNIFDSFEVLTKNELNEVKGGISKDIDIYVEDLD
ncbi:bacteriocin [Mangrovibacterium diazotrophicum]|uniref:Bacteriocin-like protein n=1 Tax=Mangrovibacterium diazotrophicum TaxID=1261403 RepID=A0A419W2K6_9BACT|nr:bacteriocin [Mangrovibacterium diazotrophicum]RKD89715.1 bacteriocin-like protein [Mangrovibacterium diazotrophicum]RKD89717.1 bacteriocin-like protein [Mangrovibacterium diazotrophicum]